ncbi:MAG TPA: crosslink repair DNA glycosylase YcaQ family protein [Actinomycetes bacterium]|nr:crosslink repair DNA glycosylase YcaQ family protein [Actinomycetes bacterium]
MPRSTSAGDVLCRRMLSRATLERQLLLRHRDLPVTEAVERLAGLNAQDPRPPYIGLWTRLDGFARDALTQALYDRGVVRSSLLRGTQHLVTPRPTTWPGGRSCSRFWTASGASSTGPPRGWTWQSSPRRPGGSSPNGP